jgi:hypothetical protein
MRVISYILLAFAVFLLASASYYQFRGSTRVADDRSSPGYTVTKEGSPEKFNHSMEILGCWGLLLIMGYFIYSIDKRFEETEPLLPDHVTPVATFWNRFLSVVLLIGYVVAARCLGDWAVEILIGLSLFLTLAVACIWFSDELGDSANVIRYHRIVTASPGFLFRIVGWFILIVFPPIAWYFAFPTF